LQVEPAGADGDESVVDAGMVFETWGAGWPLVMMFCSNPAEVSML